MSYATRDVAMEHDREHPSVDWRERIAVSPQVLAGKPVVKGTRLGVEYVLRFLAAGWTEQEVLEEYPQVTREDLRAVFAFSAEIVVDEWWSVLPARPT